MISEKEFENLKEGDRVELSCGTNGTVEGTRTKLAFSSLPAIKIKQDKKRFNCPFFGRGEIKSIIK